MVKLRLTNDGKDWEIMPKGMREEGSIYMDGVLHQSYSQAKEVMKKKSLDLVTAVSGYPGAGKSKLTSQLASFCDPTFTEDRMHQSAEEFMDAVLKEKDILKAHVLDEAWEGLSSTQVRKEVGKVFMSLMNTIRQKRLYIFLVLPDFFDLSKNIAIFRSRWLIHCYSEHFGDVGKFVAFDRKSKKQLYLRGKQYEDYSAVKGDFIGTFTNGSPKNFNWRRYEEVVKPRSLTAGQAIDTTNAKGDVSRQAEQRDRLIVILRFRHQYLAKELAGIIGCDPKAITASVRNFKKKFGEEEIDKLIKSNPTKSASGINATIKYLKNEAERTGREFTELFEEYNNKKNSLPEGEVRMTQEENLHVLEYEVAEAMKEKQNLNKLKDTFIEVKDEPKNL